MPPLRRTLIIGFAVALASCTPEPTLGPPAAKPFAIASLETLPTVYISEIHYDNTGTDAGEAIEIAGPAGTDLTGWSLVLYNGNGGAAYTTTPLTGAIPVVCDPDGVVVQNYPVNGIQNGSPDGVALVDGGGAVVEFLSYEGVFTAADGPAAGMTSTDIGVAEGSSTAVGESLQRDPTTGTWQAPQPATFGACNTAGPPPPPPPPPSMTVVSEIHYDNSGTDAGEAIELEGPAGTDLTGWSLVLYNGNGGAAYNTTVLAEVIPDLCDGRGVVVVTYPTNGIQNGSPDGVALVDGVGTVREFLSYEGTLTAADGPAAGLVSTDIGVAEGSSTEIGQSLQRDAAGVWHGPLPATFGACNGAGGPPPPPQPSITIVGRSAGGDPPLPVGFQDQLFATERAPDGTEIETAITWSSDTPDLATIDQDGVMTALAEGTAILRATAEDGTTQVIALPTRVAMAGGTAQYEGNTEFGEPADGDPGDDLLIHRPEYTSSYNPARGTPNWVSYDLDASHFGGEDRCDCFTADPELPASVTLLTTADYTGAGAFAGFGIDRGHLVRSFDRTTGSLDNAVTYYFSNIVPQAADLNQGPWADLEQDLGNRARFDDREVYIVAGVAGDLGTLKDEGKIVFPASVWKVALILPRDQGLADITGPGDFELVAVLMPNQHGIRDVDWNTYRTTVNAIEAASGYDLLGLLPDPIENVVESGVDQLQPLVDQLAAGGVIDHGEANSLGAKLAAATNQIAMGKPTPARQQLEAFVHEVEALVRSGRLSAADGDHLIAAVEGVVATL